jgi:hypothetical protein
MPIPTLESGCSLCAVVQRHGHRVVPTLNKEALIASGTEPFFCFAMVTLLPGDLLARLLDSLSPDAGTALCAGS